MNNLHICLTEFKNASRIMKETRSLAREGVFEHIYIAALNAPGLEEKQYIDRNVEVRRFKLACRAWSKSYIVQLFKYLEYGIRIWRFVRGKHIGVVNVHHVDLLPIGCALKKYLHARLVYDTHELETDEGQTGWRKKIAMVVERRLIHWCDKVFVVSESIADWYVAEYQIERPRVVLNAPDVWDLQGNDYFREKFGIPTTTRIFLYQGGLMPGRGIELLLSAFRGRTSDDAVLVLMGYGALEDDVVAASRECKRIFFHPAVDPDAVLSHTASADVGVSLIQRTNLSYYYCMPNKLFEYAMAGLPVLVSDMIEMRRFVQANRMGLVVEGDDIASVNSAVDRMCGADLREMKANSRKAALAHAWPVQEREMIEAYREMGL